MARGRKAIEVTAAELQTAIDLLENAEVFPNRSSLWRKLEETEWAKTRNPRPLTSQVAMVLAKEFKTVIKTVVGKRGRQPGQVAFAGKTGKRRKRVMSDKVRTALTVITPKNYQSVVNKAAAGSLKAAVKLKCLDCSNYQRKEIAFCTVLACPLYNFRPYKKAVDVILEGCPNAEGSNPA